MSRTYIKDASGQVGQSITIKGFVHTLRRQGGISFLIVRDVSGMLQCVVLKANETAFATAADLSHESVVAVTGKVKAEAQAPGGYELEVETIEVLSTADPELPIPVVAEKGGGDSNQNARFDHRWIDLRLPEKRNIFKVWTQLERGFRQYWLENNFIQVYTPAILGAPSESGAEVFTVKYFDREAYLAQSPQFYKQMALASGFDRVFMVGPVFRAEPSFTTRHMTEFTGWDFEMAYIDSHHDVMATEEQLLISGFKSLEANIDPEVLGSEFKVPNAPFPKLTMAEAKERLAKAGVPSEKAGDLSPQEEREISKIIEEETGSQFVWITDYPIDVRPFYHMRHADNPGLTKSFDLLFKGIEITTGAQREHRHDILLKQAQEKGMDLELLKFYTDFFKYGCPPHGGVGMGPNRIIMQLLGLPTVKESAFLPRDVKRINP
ncbi:MAG: aspartate--tRNA(Asn) ligase [Patescibacteria group bacterium]|uniref:Aspartate--tRNA(Asp/Asn) ligase n=1 Tax=candidate division WWE3 bacterium TaxID=2053526 RepID=A0A955EEF0_UNCKA|nr:aspartate--tRNA(Asn) ligase [candidate division WWE3 bacterium]